MKKLATVLILLFAAISTSSDAVVVFDKSNTVDGIKMPDNATNPSSQNSSQTKPTTTQAPSTANTPQNNTPNLSAVKDQIGSQLQNAAKQMQVGAGNITSQLQNIGGQSPNGNNTGINGTGDAGENAIMYADPNPAGAASVKQRAKTPTETEISRSRLFLGAASSEIKTAIANTTMGEDGGVNINIENEGSEWGETYKKVNELADTFILNHLDSAGKKGPLLRRDDTSGSGLNFMTNLGEVSKKLNETYTAEGGLRNLYSYRYGDNQNSNKEAIADGACQMIYMPNGPYKITALKDATYAIQGYTPIKKEESNLINNPDMGSKDPRSMAMPGYVEAINDPSHPFSPRHYTNWTDRTSSSLGYAIYANDYPQDMGGKGSSGGFSSKMSYANTESWKYTYTWVCGSKQFPNAYKFTHIMPWGRSEAWVGGYDYYKRPMGKGGHILVNDSSQTHKLSPEADKDREGKFKNKFPGEFIKYYAECYAICTAASSGFGASYCNDLCKKVGVESAEHSLCREFILPPVTPINHLKMAYNLAPEGPGSEKKGGGWRRPTCSYWSSIQQRCAATYIFRKPRRFPKCICSGHQQRQCRIC